MAATPVQGHSVLAERRLSELVIDEHRNRVEGGYNLSQPPTIALEGI